jgi:hypothetical protein
MRESVKVGTDLKTSTKALNESAMKKKEETSKKTYNSGFKRNNTTLNVASVNNEPKSDIKLKGKQASNLNVNKVDKKEEVKDKSEGKKQIIIEKESVLTNNSTSYGSNKNEDFPSPSSIAEKEIKFPTAAEPIVSATDDQSISKSKPARKIEVVVDPKILMQRRILCLKFVVRSYLKKNEIPLYMGIHKSISKAAVENLVGNFKSELKAAEKNLATFKEVIIRLK